MKKMLFSFCICFFLLQLLKAQTPQGISYQAILRNATALPITNKSIMVRFNLLDSLSNGKVLYSEIQNTTTNVLGSFSLSIGTGIAQVGTFSGVNWSKNAKYLKVEIDTSGLGSYVDLGTQQMASVPYALYAGNGVVNGNAVGDILTWNGTQWTPSKATPIVVTTVADSISVSSASSGGTLLNDCGIPIIARGVCYDTSNYPNISKKKTVDTGTVFNSSMIGLIGGRTYFVRAYVTNANGTYYGNQIKFNTYYIYPTAITTPSTSQLFIVGDCTPGGWANPVPTPTQQFKKINSYTYQIDSLSLSAFGTFSLIPTNGSWTTKYTADTTYSIPSVCTSNVQPIILGGSANIPGPVCAGKFKIVVNFNAGTVTLTKL